MDYFAANSKQLWNDSVRSHSQCWPFGSVPADGTAKFCGLVLIGVGSGFEIRGSVPVWVQNTWFGSGSGRFTHT